jgi:hypothetical protein
MKHLFGYFLQEMQAALRLRDEQKLIDNPQYQCIRCELEIQGRSNDLKYLLFTCTDYAYCNGCRILQYLNNTCKWLPPIQFCDKSNALILADIGDPLSVECDQDYLGFMLDQFSAQLADLHHNGIAHGAISSDSLYFNEEYAVATLFAFGDAIPLEDEKDSQHMFLKDWRAFIELLQNMDKKKVFRNSFQQAEILLSKSDIIPIQEIADLFHDERDKSDHRRSNLYSKYEFLSRCTIVMPITDLGRLAEYIIYYYIQRLLLSNGYRIDENLDRVIGQSVKVNYIEGVSLTKISSHVFGWIWLRRRLEELKSANAEIFEIAKWKWNDTQKFEMNFRSEMRLLNDDVMDFSYFPFSSELIVYRFVHEHGSIRLSKVEDARQMIPRLQNNIQAFVEFYSQDSSMYEASKIDNHILQKLFQVLKSITAGLSEEFYRTENYGVDDSQGTLHNRRDDNNIDRTEFNQIAYLKNADVDWNWDIIGFSAICIASENADFKDPNIIQHSSRMIEIFPELFDLVLRGKLFLLHIPQNLRDLLMKHRNVRISRDFDEGFIKFIHSAAKESEKKAELESLREEKKEYELLRKEVTLLRKEAKEAKLLRRENELLRKKINDLETSLILKLLRKLYWILVYSYFFFVEICKLIYSVIKER